MFQGCRSCILSVAFIGQDWLDHLKQVDLNGLYSRGARPLLLAARPAPLLFTRNGCCLGWCLLVSCIPGVLPPRCMAGAPS